MTDLRESVARAMWKDASERGADGFDSALDYQWHETDEDTRQTFLDDASAALRAVADAGFVIVPREGLMQAAQRAEQAMRAWYEYQYNNKGTFDGKSERHDLVNAWRSLAAALKEMG